MAQDNFITTFDDVKLPNSGEKRNPFGKKNETKEQPDTQFWLNVGLMRGEGDQRKLVSLPGGIALDRLIARKIPSSETKNQDFRNLRIAEAQLWEKFQSIMNSLKPGERRVLKLDVEIYRIKENEVVDLENQPENPYSVGDLS